MIFGRPLSRAYVRGFSVRCQVTMYCGRTVNFTGKLPEQGNRVHGQLSCGTDSDSVRHLSLPLPQTEVLSALPNTRIVNCGQTTSVIATLVESLSRAWGNCGSSLGRKFLIFFKWCILVYFIFLSDGGAPKRRGARGSLPPPYPTLSTGLVIAAT